MESTVLVKAFLLLEVLSREEEPTTLAAICEQVALTKPTVHRLMGNLISLGFVQRVGTGRYQVTEKLRSLGTGSSQGQLLNIAEPIMLDLYNKTGETVNLGELRGDQIIYLRVMESTHPLRRVISAGEKDQAISTALGRAIIANLTKNTQDRFFKKVAVTEHTTKTILDIKKIRRLIKEVTEKGYAFERDENELGVTCYGAPIFDGSAVVAALSMSVPTARVDDSTEKELIEFTKQAASEISRALA